MKRPAKENIKVGFVDYLSRNNWWHAKEFFYDLIKLNLENYFENLLIISKSLRMEVMLQKGDTGYQYFHEPFEEGWQKSYEKFYDEENIYLEYIRRHNCIFCYEASPSVLNLLARENKRYCDLRISPIRFLPDVLIAVKTNDLALSKKLREVTIKISEMKKESAKIQVMYKYRFRGENGYVNESRVIFVGQTEDDSSLYFSGKICRITDFSEEIRSDVKKRKLFYIPHPAAGAEHIETEISFLRELAGQCEVLQTEAYRLLSEGEDDFFIGISSGLLQEARLFGKNTKSYIPFACPVYFSDSEIGRESIYYQIPLDIFLSKEFFEIFITQSERQLPLIKLLSIRENQLRFLHSAWWAYAFHVTAPNQVTESWMNRLGIDRINNCQAVLSETQVVLAETVRDYHSKMENEVKNIWRDKNSFLETEAKRYVVKRIIVKKKKKKRYYSFLASLFFFSKEKRDYYTVRARNLQLEIKNLKN